MASNRSRGRGGVKLRGRGRGRGGVRRPYDQSFSSPVASSETPAVLSPPTPVIALSQKQAEPVASPSAKSSLSTAARLQQALENLVSKSNQHSKAATEVQEKTQAAFRVESKAAENDIMDELLNPQKTVESYRVKLDGVLNLANQLKNQTAFSQQAMQEDLQRIKLLVDDVRELEKKQDEAAQKNQALEQKINQLAKEKEQAEQKQNALQQKLTQTEKQVEELQRTHVELERRLADALNQAKPDLEKELTAALTKSKTEEANLLERAMALTNEKKELQKRLDFQLKKIERLEIEMRTLSEKLSHSETQLKQSYAANDSIKTELTGARERNRNSGKKQSDAEKTIRELKEKLQQEQQVTKTQLVAIKRLEDLRKKTSNYDDLIKRFEILNTNYSNLRNHFENYVRVFLGKSEKYYAFGRRQLETEVAHLVQSAQSEFKGQCILTNAAIKEVLVSGRSEATVEPRSFFEFDSPIQNCYQYAIALNEVVFVLHIRGDILFAVQRDSDINAANQLVFESAEACHTVDGLKEILEKADLHPEFALSAISVAVDDSGKAHEVRMLLDRLPDEEINAATSSVLPPASKSESDQISFNDEKEIMCIRFTPSPSLHCVTQRQGACKKSEDNKKMVANDLKTVPPVVPSVPRHLQTIGSGNQARPLQSSPPAPPVGHKIT